MQDAQRGLRWFRALFVAVMLAVCVLLAYLAVDRTRLLTTIEDLTVGIKVNRDLMVRQNLEYDQAVAALPETQAELERVAPLAEAAKEREMELRQQRKDIRAENAALQEEIAAAQEQLDGLLEQAAVLQEAAANIQDILQAP